MKESKKGKKTGKKWKETALFSKSAVTETDTFSPMLSRSDQTKNKLLLL